MARRRRISLEAREGGAGLNASFLLDGEDRILEGNRDAEVFFEKPLDDVRKIPLQKANPALYDIHRSLKLEAREWWGCLQHTGRIRAGDRVLIWISGPRAGIYAVGELETGPSLRPDSPVGLRPGAASR